MVAGGSHTCWGLNVAHELCCQAADLLVDSGYVDVYIDPRDKIGSPLEGE